MSQVDDALYPSDLLRVIGVELGVGIFGHHLVYERLNCFALRAPCCRSLENVSAVSVAGLQVVSQLFQFFHVWRDRLLRAVSYKKSMRCVQLCYISLSRQVKRNPTS